MKKLRLLVLTFAAVLSLTAVAGQIDAQAKVVTVPTSLRGRWFSKGSYGTQFIKMTKYTFYVANYVNGRKQSGSWGVSGRRYISGTKIPTLYRSSHKTPKGYWKIGAAHSDGVWYLKRVHHNGRVALRSWSPYDNSISYYYHR